MIYCEYIKANLLNPILLIKVLLKVTYKLVEWLQTTFRGTFINKRGFRMWTKIHKTIFVFMDLNNTSILILNKYNI